ncbi:MAG: hypothetical protein Q8R33_15965 [Burkholderiales bacterium]|nr:hypothetical protein [Burkholderiales bacterium]
MGVLAYLLIFLRSKYVLRDGDTYSHVAAGNWIIENGVVPTQDPFSHTMRGAAWTAFEWLSQVLLAAAHQLSGWTGLVALTALAFAVTISLLTRALLRWLEPIYALMFAGLAISMTAGHVLARPHMLAMPLMMIWTIELVRARDANRRPSFWLLPLMTIWANLHGGFTLGIAFAFAFALEAMLEARRQQRFAATVQSWSTFLVLAVGCALLTPHGTRGFAVTWQVLFQDSYALSRIGEWSSPNFHNLQPLELWLLGGLALVLYQGLRLPPVRLLLLLGLIHISLKHVRNVELLGLLAPLFLASPLAGHWRQRKRAKPQLESADLFFRKLANPADRGATLLTLAVFLALSLWIGRNRPLDIPESTAPRAAIQAALDSGLGKGRVLNAYQWGGYLIYLGIPPFIDGRSDMYRDAFIKEYLFAIELQTTDGLEKLLARHKVTWTLLPPDLAAVALLDRLPGWRRVYEDGVAVVHARTPSPLKPTPRETAP